MPPKFLVRLVLGVHDFLIRLAHAVVPPQLALYNHLTGLGATMGLHLAARFGVPDLLAAGPLTAAELAAKVDAHPEALHRALRALATIGVFTLDRQGQLANNRLSSALRSDVPGSLKSFAEYLGSWSNVTAWADLEGTIRTGKNAFRRVHGKSVWDWFKEHPGEGATFAQTMVELTRLDAPIVARAYPFSEVRRLCDVAGGRGTLLAEVLATHPHLEGVLLDEAYVLQGRKRCSPPDLQDLLGALHGLRLLDLGDQRQSACACAGT